MKTVVVTGIGDTRNNGCWAMAASAMTSIREASPVPVKFIILNRKNSLDIKRLALDNVEFVARPWTLVTVPRGRLLWILLCAALLSVQGCLYHFFPRKMIFREYWEAMRQADLVLDLSGDSISSDYNWVANFTVMLPLLIARLMGKPYFLCAQSIGPFGDSRIDRLTIGILRAANLITTREGRTTEILARLGIVDNVRRTEDLAFLLTPTRSPERERLFQREGIDPATPWVGVSVSSIIASYAFRDLPGAAREAAYLDALALFCDELYERYGYRTLFVPHVTIPNKLDDDRHVTAKVRERMRHGESSSTVEGDCTGAELKAVIGLCRFFVGSRMHATIGALSQGIPTLTLVYNHKTLGINGDVLGQHDYLIDIRSIRSDVFGKTLGERFAALVSNEESVRAKLLSLLPSVREGSRQNAWFALDFLEIAGPLQYMRHPWHCTGCGTCAGVCPEAALVMRETPQGTLRPGLRQRCTGCRLCNRVCPSLGLDVGDAERSRFAQAQPEGDLGVCRSCRTGYATDHETRFHGSSGGLVTAIAGHLLESGGVDAVLVVAAEPGNPFRQKARWAVTREELSAAQGSRYLPAAVNDAFAAVPPGAKKLGVIGLPCHLWGVQRLQESGLLGVRSIEWRLGLFCGRTPSLHAADTMLAGLGITRSETSGFTFRGEGWPGISSIVAAKKQLRMPLDQMWSFVGSPFFTPAHCFACPEFSAVLSDLSFGDAWLPECRGDAVGTSLVLARSGRGADLLNEAMEKGVISTSEVSPDRVAAAFRSNLRRKQHYGASKAQATGGAFPVRYGTVGSGGIRVSSTYRYEWLLSKLGSTPLLRRAVLRYPASPTMRLLRRVAIFLQRGR